MESLGKLTTNVGQMFIEMSSEYSVWLNLVFILMAAVGTLIIASGVFEVTRMGKPGRTEASVSSILWKFAGGAMLVDLSMGTHIWAASLWGNYDPLDISAYTATGKGGADGFSQEAMMAATGIIVIAGYVALARAYIGMAKLGKTPEEQRGELWGIIISRVVAGSAMVSILWLAKIFGNTVGLS